MEQKTPPPTQLENNRELFENIKKKLEKIHGLISTEILSQILNQGRIKETIEKYGNPDELKVISYDKERGFGFAKKSGDSTNMFFHISDIEDDGEERLKHIRGRNQEKITIAPQSSIHVFGYEESKRGKRVASWSINGETLKKKLQEQLVLFPDSLIEKEDITKKFNDYFSNEFTEEEIRFLFKSPGSIKMHFKIEIATGVFYEKTFDAFFISLLSANDGFKYITSTRREIKIGTPIPKIPANDYKLKPENIEQLKIVQDFFIHERGIASVAPNGNDSGYTIPNIKITNTPLEDILQIDAYTKEKLVFSDENTYITELGETDNYPYKLQIEINHPSLFPERIKINIGNIQMKNGIPCLAVKYKADDPIWIFIKEKVTTFVETSKTSFENTLLEKIWAGDNNVLERLFIKENSTHVFSGGLVNYCAYTNQDPLKELDSEDIPLVNVKNIREVLLEKYNEVQDNIQEKVLDLNRKNRVYMTIIAGIFRAAAISKNITSTNDGQIKSYYLVDKREERDNLGDLFGESYKNRFILSPDSRVCEHKLTTRGFFDTDTGMVIAETTHGDIEYGLSREQKTISGAGILFNSDYKYTFMEKDFDLNNVTISRTMLNALKEQKEQEHAIFTKLTGDPKITEQLYHSIVGYMKKKVDEKIQTYRGTQVFPSTGRSKFNDFIATIAVPKSGQELLDIAQKLIDFPSSLDDLYSDYKLTVELVEKSRENLYSKKRLYNLSDSASSKLFGIIREAETQVYNGNIEEAKELIRQVEQKIQIMTETEAEKGEENEQNDAIWNEDYPDEEKSAEEPPQVQEEIPEELILEMLPAFSGQRELVSAFIFEIKKIPKGTAEKDFRERFNSQTNVKIRELMLLDTLHKSPDFNPDIAIPKNCLKNEKVCNFFLDWYCGKQES